LGRGGIHYETVVSEQADHNGGDDAHSGQKAGAEGGGAVIPDFA